MPHLICIAHVPTPAVSDGFLPAARALGLEVSLLTDCPEENREQFASRPRELRPDRILGCDVFNPVAIADTVYDHGLKADALFSNSDHLQTATALAGRLLGVLHKSERACYLCKHKSQMRKELARQGLETVWHRQFADLAELRERLAEIRFPCVTKPCKGVASLQVEYAEDAPALVDAARRFWEKSPHRPLLVEEFLAGTIYSLETLGDVARCHVLGGFTCTLTPLPYFIETEARWGLPEDCVDYVARALRALEATFGACHTEFVLTPSGPRIIEVNYRSIGDQSDFMLDRLMSGTYFQAVLRAQLGQVLDLTPIPSDWHSAARYLFAERSGVLTDVPAARVEQQEGYSIHYLPARRSGDRVELSHSNKDYLALLHVTGPGRDAVEARLREQTIRVQEAIRWA